MVEETKLSRFGNWMQTHSGRKYYPYDPRPEDILVDDVAHHLSMLCRFTGATRRFYSVAEHCFHVSKLVPQEHALSALLHDGPEYVLNDLNTTVKIGLAEYKSLEALNWYAMAEAFDLPLVLDPCVKAADTAMLFVERRALMPPCPVDEWAQGLLKEPDPYPEVGPLGWSQPIAKERFYGRFFELTQTR